MKLEVVNTFSDYQIEQIKFLSIEFIVNKQVTEVTFQVEVSKNQSCRLAKIILGNIHDLQKGKN